MVCLAGWLTYYFTGKQARWSDGRLRRVLDTGRTESVMSLEPGTMLAWEVVAWRAAEGSRTLVAQVEVVLQMNVLGSRVSALGDSWAAVMHRQDIAAIVSGNTASCS